MNPHAEAQPVAGPTSRNAGQRQPMPTHIDLGDVATFGDPKLLDVFRELRRHAPVAYQPPSAVRGGFWAITRYDDILEVYKDSTHFTSTRGNVLATLLQGYDSASGKMLAVSDGRRHRAIRSVMLKSFSPRTIARIEGNVTERTSALIAAAATGEVIDFAATVEDHIPINTIGDLMDIPICDRAQLVEWNSRTLAQVDEGEDSLDQLVARNEILMYFHDIAEHRRRQPGDDVISALVNSLVDGKPLSDDEITLNCYSLVLGGDESSRMSSTGSVLALADHPEAHDQLIAGLAGLDTAVEEFLRWTTPAMHFGRRCTADRELRGQLISAGDVVTLWNISANDDEEIFHNPRQLDLTRDPNRHMSFGQGAHYCLGAFLGRLHLRAVLQALVAHTSRIHRAGEPRALRSNFIQGHSYVPVILEPRYRSGS